MNGMQKMGKVIEALGEELAFQELLQALNHKELEENAEYIARNWDIDLDEEVE